METQKKSAKRDAIIVGVTGRRRIVQGAIPFVEATTRELFRALANAANAPIVVETGLAVGADSIAARAAIEEREKHETSRIRVRAVTPFPVEEYERDFNAEELETFRALLRACDEIVELPANSETKRNRARQYAALGEKLVEESVVLVSYWSGDVSVVKEGGTVDVTLAMQRAIAEGKRAISFSVRTPEIARVIGDDGVKRRVPEPTDGAGECALASEPADRAPLVFRPAAQGIDELLRALHKLETNERP